MRNFMGAVIDEAAFAPTTRRSQRRARTQHHARRRRRMRRQRGWFVRPTIFETADPRHDLMERGALRPDPHRAPVRRRRLGDAPAHRRHHVTVCADRRGVRHRPRRNRHRKPRSPQRRWQLLHQRQAHRRGGGSAAVRWRTRRGTNDKAGSPLNLLRWVSARAIKETFNPPTDWRYPHQEAD